MKRLPGADKRDIVLAALGELIYVYPQLLVRQTNMPGLGGATLLAHLDATIEGTYPA